MLTRARVPFALTLVDIPRLTFEPLLPELLPRCEAGEGMADMVDIVGSDVDDVRSEPPLREVDAVLG